MATLYAAEFPEHVGALVLVAPAAVLVIPPEDGGLFGWVKERLPEEAQADYGRFMGEYFNFGTIFTKTEDDLVELNRRFMDFYAVASGMPDSVEIPAPVNTTIFCDSTMRAAISSMPVCSVS